MNDPGEKKEGECCSETTGDCTTTKEEMKEPMTNEAACEDAPKAA